MSIFTRRRPLNRLGLKGPDTAAPQREGKDWDIDKLALAAAASPTVDLTHLVVSILDQGDSSSCVSQAWEQAIRMERKKLGYPVVLGSRLFGYANARAEHGEEHTDAGTFLRTYAWGLKKVGSCPESVWPYNLKNVNKHPPPMAFREAWALRGLRGYYKIFDLAAARTAGVRAALDASHPVPYGTQVDYGFLEDTGPIIVDVPKGSLAGGHAMTLVGYKPDSFYGYLYRNLNSWSEGWREGGYCWITEEYLQWYHTSDLWVASFV